MATTEEILPDALGDALAVVIADLRSEWEREKALITAEARAVVAEFKLAASGADGANFSSRLDSAEKRLDATEGRGLRFCGVYQRAAEYQRGDAVTADGSLFIALTDNPQGDPGGSNDWQLAVKRGRDGKDAGR
jgi:hypothetical protein